MGKRTGGDPARMIRQLKALERTMPGVAGTIAVGGFKDNFIKQGFVDERLVKWQKRKPRAKDKGRAILVDTGDLKRSIRVIKKGLAFISIGTSTEYGIFHNEGSTKGKANLPQRQFVGESKSILKQIEKRYIERLKRILE